MSFDPRKDFYSVGVSGDLQFVTFNLPGPLPINGITISMSPAQAGEFIELLQTAKEVVEGKVMFNAAGGVVVPIDEGRNH